MVQSPLIIFWTSGSFKYFLTRRNLTSENITNESEICRSIFCRIEVNFMKFNNFMQCRFQLLGQCLCRRKHINAKSCNENVQYAWMSILIIGEWLEKLILMKTQSVRESFFLDTRSMI